MKILVLLLVAACAASFASAQQATPQIVAQARSEIESAIRRDRRLGPKFLRLAFHDCVGGCDGTST